MELSSLETTNGLDVIQSMIDISADRLEGLRTQCATSATLTQHEIRSLEAKLVKMFSELLMTKSKLPERIPSSGLSTSNSELKQWLRVVGLSAESLNVCLQRTNTLEQLLERSKNELKDLLLTNPNVKDEEIRRLSGAMDCLRNCKIALQEGSKQPEHLFWDSWDRHHHNHYHRNSGISNNNSIITLSSSSSSPRSNRTIIKQTNKLQQQTIITNDNSLANNITKDDSSNLIHRNLTPSPSPPNSPNVNNSGNSINYKSTHRKSGTPPPNRKHQTLLSNQQQQIQYSPVSSNINNQINNHNNLDFFAQITKSKSHEFQLNQETDKLSNQIPRTRLHTEPGTDILLSNNELQSNLGNDNNQYTIDITNNLQVPRSPCTPLISLGMGHMIAHRFTKVFKVMSTCDLCQKQMFFGLKCKECKYRCHKDCEINVTPSCGLPREFVDEFKKTLQSNDVFLPNTSPNLGNRIGGISGGGVGGGFLTACRKQKTTLTSGYHHTHDSSSPGSSCNSSSPSSPALFGLNNTNLHCQQNIQNYNNSGTINTILTPISAQKQTLQFHFPDVTKNKSNLNQQQHQQQQIMLPGVTIETYPLADNDININNCTNKNSIGQKSITNNIKNQQQLKQKVTNQNLSDTNKSNDSDKTVSLSGSISTSTDSDRTPIRLDSTEEGDSGNWPRQNSLSLKEWDIPYDDLHLLEKIGNGRFGTVHRALWHGDVAVKLLKEDYLNDERTLEAFKLEVATFKKTRHENLVLFMGACMNPPFLAIVTSLCKGNTLYTYIHIRRDKFNLNRTTLVAQQISQGMGYLHARGIYHKDLRTKNIFLENGKVIITDFGLFSSTKLVYGNLGLSIPNGWLCYLAPELIRTLTSYRPTNEILPFSRGTDVYSFGTVWYELLCGEFPFKSQPSESVIWQVGRGMKQTLANLQTSRDVKDILMLCWSYQNDDRPDFAKLLSQLERLPKKRLARSPSHPVQLSRSAESVF